MPRTRPRCRWFVAATGRIDLPCRGPYRSSAIPATLRCRVALDHEKAIPMTKRRRRDDADALAESYLQHELMNETKDYLDRGRRFKLLAVTELNEKWVIVFRRFTAHDRTPIGEMDDLAAELRLRGLDPPYDRVRSEMSKLQDEIKRLGPDAPSDRLDERIARFLAEHKKAKN